MVEIRVRSPNQKDVWEVSAPQSTPDGGPSHAGRGHYCHRFGLHSISFVSPLPIDYGLSAFVD